MNKFVLWAFIILTSCSSEYGNENIIEDIISNKPNRIINNFYQKSKLEKEEFKDVVKLYSDFLYENKLTKIVFDDQVTFNARKRQGFIFLNEDNNFVASITFMFVTLADSSTQINFIDFRNSTEQLPCIKFPSKFPIKCLDLPVPFPPNLDSLKKNYPKIISGRKFYHSSMCSKNYLAETGDTLKKIISLNNGNKLIARNLNSILLRIDDELGLKNYNLCEANMIGEPTINLSYDSQVHLEIEIETIKRIIEDITKTKVRLSQDKTFNSSIGFAEPMIRIGYPLSKARVTGF